ncbi:hypothetical protein PV350_01110 [Streptomyces sp. PA03-6a]|nr:hypothetical protein [Streptomyces sp. PA03-6a]
MLLPAVVDQQFTTAVTADDHRAGKTRGELRCLIEADQVTGREEQQEVVRWRKEPGHSSLNCEEGAVTLGQRNPEHPLHLLDLG